VVLLSFGGVVMATLFATFASMLATEGERGAEPPKKQAEVDQELTPRTDTSLVVSPDGTTSTVVVTVSTSPRDRQAKASGEPPPRAADGPPEGERQPREQQQPDQTEQERPAPPTTTAPSSPPSTATTSQLPSTSPVTPPTTTPPDPTATTPS
jgi:hypothetical protein